MLIFIQHQFAWYWKLNNFHNGKLEQKNSSRLTILMQK